MAALRALLLVLMTATLVVGGTARAMPAPAAAPPPCHEAPASQGHHDKSKPGPAQAAMSCCVGCMPAPNLAVAVQRSASTERPVYARATPRQAGRLTAPEPDPPRLRA